MSFEFRSISGADGAVALPAILALVGAEARRPGGLLDVQEPDLYARLLGGDAGEVFAAYAGGALIGFAGLGFGPRVGPRWRSHADAMGASSSASGVCVQTVVSAEHRGVGVASRLHSMRLLAARRRGLTHLFAAVHPDNRVMLRVLDATRFLEVERGSVHAGGGPRVLLARALERPTLAAPRIPLARLPTAVEPLPRLSAALGGPAIYVKRDDTVGLATGGNKSRMLEYLIADALAAGARTLITRGHRLSNHCRQTAAAAARLGLGCRLVLRGEPSPVARGNEFLDALLGARITWTRDRDPDRVVDDVLAASDAAGERPYRIAYGGAQVLGAVAYAEAFREIEDAGETFDRVYVATSSGATQAGLVAGKALAGSATRIIGVGVDEGGPALRRSIARLAGEVGRVYGVGPLAICEADVELDERHAADGYGVVGPAEREAITLFARCEGLLLDPVYTGRAAAGLIHQCRRGEIGPGERVLFLHTGGLPSLFAFSGEVARS